MRFIQVALVALCVLFVEGWAAAKKRSASSSADVEASAVSNAASQSLSACDNRVLVKERGAKRALMSEDYMVSEMHYQALLCQVARLCHYGNLSNAQAEIALTALASQLGVSARTSTGYDVLKRVLQGFNEVIEWQRQNPQPQADFYERMFLLAHASALTESVQGAFLASAFKSDLFNILMDGFSRLQIQRWILAERSGRHASSGIPDAQLSDTDSELSDGSSGSVSSVGTQQELTMSTEEVDAAFRRFQQLIGEERLRTPAGQDILVRLLKMLESDRDFILAVRAVGMLTEDGPGFERAWDGLLSEQRFDQFFIENCGVRLADRNDARSRSVVEISRRVDQMAVSSPELVSNLIAECSRILSTLKGPFPISETRSAVLTHEAESLLDATLKELSRPDAEFDPQEFDVVLRQIAELLLKEPEGAILQCRSLPLTMWPREWRKILKSDTFRPLREWLASRWGITLEEFERDQEQHDRTLYSTAHKSPVNVHAGSSLVPSGETRSNLSSLFSTMSLGHGRKRTASPRHLRGAQSADHRDGLHESLPEPTAESTRQDMLNSVALLMAAPSADHQDGLQALSELVTEPTRQDLLDDVDLLWDEDLPVGGYERALESLEAGLQADTNTLEGRRLISHVLKVLMRYRELKLPTNHLARSPVVLLALETRAMAQLKHAIATIRTEGIVTDAETGTAFASLMAPFTFDFRTRKGRGDFERVLTLLRSHPTVRQQVESAGQDASRCKTEWERISHSQEFDVLGANSRSDWDSLPEVTQVDLTPIVPDCVRDLHDLLDLPESVDAAKCFLSGMYSFSLLAFNTPFSSGDYAELYQRLLIELRKPKHAEAVSRILSLPFSEQDDEWLAYMSTLYDDIGKGFEEWKARGGALGQEEGFQ